MAGQPGCAGACVADVQQTFVLQCGNVLRVSVPRRHLTAADLQERARRRANFGARLRSLRQELGLTQEQVALRAGLDRPFLVQLEGGKRSILVERLEDLARAVGTTPAELVAEGEISLFSDHGQEASPGAGLDDGQ